MNPKIVVTPEDKKFYQENGFWMSPKIFSDEQVARLRQAHERIWSYQYDGDGYPLSDWVTNGDPYQLRKIDNAWWINEEVKSAVTNPILGEIAAQLMDTDEVRLWYDQAIYKPGTQGSSKNQVGNVGWHQDYVYWQCTNHTHLVTAWIALQDTDLSNGCMSAIPGSHRWGLSQNSEGFFSTDLDAQKARIMAEGKPWAEVPMTLKAGQASFHHAFTFHGSGPNLSNQPRLSIVAHLMPQGTAYQNRGQNVDNIRLLGPHPKEGQLYDNLYFPVVYKRNK